MQENCALLKGLGLGSWGCKRSLFDKGTEWHLFTQLYVGHINLCWAGFPWAASVCVTGKKSEIPLSSFCFFSQHWALLGKDGEGNGVPTASTSFPLSSGENSTLQGPAVPLMRYVNQGRDLRFPAVSLHYYIYIYTHITIYNQRNSAKLPFPLVCQILMGTIWILLCGCGLKADTHFFTGFGGSNFVL